MCQKGIAPMSQAIQSEESTQVRLILVQGSKMENKTITLDGDTGEANIGGQWTNGRLKVNISGRSSPSKNDQTVCEINAEKGYIKLKNTSGVTQIVLDGQSGNAYTTGKVIDGQTPEELDRLFP